MYGTHTDATRVRPTPAENPDRGGSPLRRSIGQGVATLETTTTKAEQPDMTPDDFAGKELDGRRLRVLRLATKIKQTDLARALGIEPTKYNRIEAGKGQLMGRELEPIAVRFEAAEIHGKSLQTWFRCPFVDLLIPARTGHRESGYQADGMMRTFPPRGGTRFLHQDLAPRNIIVDRPLGGTRAAAPAVFDLHVEATVSDAERWKLATLLYMLKRSLESEFPGDALRCEIDMGEAELTSAEAEPPEAGKGHQ